MSKGAWFTPTQQEYVDLLSKCIDSLEARRKEAEALNCRAIDALQDLLDYIYMIAPEADAEEIDEAKRVLRAGQ